MICGAGILPALRIRGERPSGRRMQPRSLAVNHVHGRARFSHQVSSRGRRSAVPRKVFSSPGAEAYIGYVEHPYMRKPGWVLCIVVRSRQLVGYSGCGVQWKAMMVCCWI